MKRIFHPIIAIMLIVAMFPSIASAETSYETIKSVSLKQSASTKAKTIITIPKGKTVTHLSNKGSWSNIQYGKYKGFVAKRDIRKKSYSNNETLPPPTYQYTQYASYKGGTIISIYGKSYQIDAPLLPFFKKNAHVLNTIFGIPILNKNKLIGYKELQFDTFRPNQNGKVVSIHIDPQAAQKIETFVIPAHSSFSPTYKIFATAPVRQIATSRIAAKELYEKTTHIELYGGPFQQVDLTGEVNVAGKATINRLVLRKGDLYPSTHSYTSGIDLSGTITHLESSHSDAQVTIGKTTLIRNVKGVSTSQVLDGQFGLIRGKRPNAAVVQGRWMNEDERKISEWTELLMKSKVSDSDLLAWFEQIDLQDVNKTYLPSYRLALETNAKATNTRVNLGTTYEWQRLIDDVNASLETTRMDTPYVLVEDDDAIIRHDRPLRDFKSGETDYFQRELIGIIDPSGQFEQIAFKRTFSNPMLHQFGTPNLQENFSLPTPYKQSGTYRHVSIRNGKRHLISVEVALTNGKLGVISVNGQPLESFQQKPPKVEVKLVEGYLFIRSKDEIWMRHAQQIKMSGVSGERVQLAKGNLAQAGDWNNGNYLSVGGYGLSKGKSIRIQAYGYSDVIVRIP